MSVKVKRYKGYKIEASPDYAQVRWDGECYAVFKGEDAAAQAKEWVEKIGQHIPFKNEAAAQGKGE